MTETGFRRLTIALLVLNLFVACVLVGGGITFLTATPPGPVPRLPLAGEQLPSADREAFQAALNETRRALRSTGLEARQARIEAAALLGEPQVDKTAIGDALKRARDAETALRAALEQRAIDFVAGLPLDDRRQLAEGLIAREVPAPAKK